MTSLYLSQVSNGDQVEIDFTKFAPATLEALAADPAVPGEWRADAKTELDQRSADEKPEGEGLAANAERRAAAAKSKPGMSMTPGNGGIKASHDKPSTNALVRNAERRAAAGISSAGGDVIGPGNRRG